MYDYELANMLGQRVQRGELTGDQASFIAAEVRESRMTAAEALTAAPATDPRGEVIDLGLSGRELYLSKLIHVDGMSVEKAYHEAFNPDLDNAEVRTSIESERARLTKKEQQRRQDEHDNDPQVRLQRIKAAQAAESQLDSDATLLLIDSGIPQSVLDQLTPAERIAESGLVPRDTSMDDSYENNVRKLAEIEASQNEGGEGA